MMDSLNSVIGRQLSAFSLVCLVNRFALGAVGAAQAASDCDTDRDAYGQPNCDVACEHAGGRTNASAESNPETDLRRRFLHVRLPLTADSSPETGSE
jgi:hypothetical protein